MSEQIIQLSDRETLPPLLSQIVSQAGEGSIALHSFAKMGTWKPHETMSGTQPFYTDALFKSGLYISDSIP